MSLTANLNCPVRRPQAGLLLLRALGLVLALWAPCMLPAQQFTFREYGQQDGLSNLDVSALTQDEDGYIWVGTENGLFRHDSADFQRFDDNNGLADTAIHSVVTDSSNRLWVGTSQDLYEREGEHFQPIRPDGHPLSVRAGSRIAALAPGRLLVVDREELRELWQTPADRKWHSRLRFSTEQSRSTPALSHLSSVFVDGSGRIWLGCGTAICSVEDGRVHLWRTEDGVPADAWHTWLLDDDGTLWARGLQHIVTLRRESASFVNRDAPHSKLTAGIMNVPLIKDSGGHVITRSDIGLLRWDRDHWEELTADNGITTPEISALLSTPDGSVWVGTSGHGVWRWLGYGNFESWTVRRGASSNPVWVVLRGPDHAIIMGTRSGCMRIDAKTRVGAPCVFRGLPAGEIQVMAKGLDDSLWLGMATGQLFHVPAGEITAHRVATQPQTRKLFVDSSGRLWICSNSGIRYIRAGSTHLEEPQVPQGLGEVADVAQDSEGVLWFATQGGLLRWSEERWALLQLPLPTPDGFAAVAAAPGGWLWAGGASHGLMHLHTRGSQVDQAQWITESNIAHAAAYFTQVDSRGWLWVGTDDGFALFDGHAWRKFGQADGLIWNDTDQNAVFADADGSIWIGTSGGLSHVLRPEKLAVTTALHLHMARATLGGAQLAPGTPLRIGWSPQLALDLRLSDLDFVEASKLLLRVRLRGLSDAYFDSHHFDIHYPALAPARYTFEAVAVDADQQRSSPLVSLSFEVQPPWWQTWWLKSLVAAIACILIAAAWRWSALRQEARRLQLERELREREELLERATRDPLTRLWNRQAILDILTREIDTAKAAATPLAVAIIDVDHFKRVNDTLGHLAGDEVLRTLAARLATNIRTRDALGRYGGEELLLILPEAAPLRPFLPIERLRQIVAETPFAFEGASLTVTASFGVAWLASRADSVHDLLARADAALYAAKDRGRDRVEYAATGSD